MGKESLWSGRWLGLRACPAGNGWGLLVLPSPTAAWVHPGREVAVNVLWKKLRMSESEAGIRKGTDGEGKAAVIWHWTSKKGLFKAGLVWLQVRAELDQQLFLPLSVRG